MATKFRKELRKQTAVAIVAAFGFLIALAWRDFITELVNSIIAYFSLEASLHWYKLVAAVLVTIISVVGIMIASKLNADEEKK
jgi:uncharacterized membrane protein (DUF106 family)